MDEEIVAKQITEFSKHSHIGCVLLGMDGKGGFTTVVHATIADQCVMLQFAQANLHKKMVAEDEPSDKTTK